MALIVQKFGGTSVGSVERVRNVARRVAKWKAAGHDLVVVPSAMAGETDRLIGLAREIQALPDPRELDVVAATGEQVTIGLLAMALMDLGVKARSYTGWQVKIVSDSAHNKARIVSIDQQRIRADLHEGYVVVVAGFQGVDSHGTLTTFGRGGCSRRRRPLGGAESRNAGAGAWSGPWYRAARAAAARRGARGTRSRTGPASRTASSARSPTRTSPSTSACRASATTAWPTGR